jgi:hypothetical protein
VSASTRQGRSITLKCCIILSLNRIRFRELCNRRCAHVSRIHRHCERADTETESGVYCTFYRHRLAIMAARRQKPCIKRTATMMHSHLLLYVRTSYIQVNKRVRGTNLFEKEMKMANPRFAYSSPLLAGERRTVRHVIGALRQIEAETSKMVGASHGDIRRNGANSYAF